jgi:hypothetical protein
MDLLIKIVINYIIITIIQFTTTTISIIITSTIPIITITTTISIITITTS